jgi:hypothetical protein
MPRRQNLPFYTRFAAVASKCPIFTYAMTADKANSLHPPSSPLMSLSSSRLWLAALLVVVWPCP